MEDLGSSPLSWRTAPGTPATPESTMLEDTDTVFEYRTAKQLPQELRDACKVFFEEGLLAYVLSLENELLTSPSNPDAPSFMQPPISHISFVSTLLVHPKYTTRAKDDHRGLQSHALTFLRNLLATMGPRNAKLNEAFVFKQQPQRSGYGRSSKVQRPRASSDGSEEKELEELNIPMATIGGLWAKAQDFWHVIGWAFNCSVVHRERWEFWKIWLDYMVDVMDADWLQRETTDLEAWETLKQTEPKAEEIFEARVDSIICQYTSSQCGRPHIKRLIKSIFANGDDGFLKQFPEVFAREAIPSRKDNSSRKKQIFRPVDLENGDFRAYSSSDDDADVEDAESNLELITPACSAEDDHDGTADDLSLTMGGHESMALRLRLMALLSRISHVLPRDDAIPIRDLYFKFAENLLPLPIDSMSLFTSIHAIPHLPQECLSTLCQATLNGIIDEKALEPNDWDVNVENLVECFLPFAANTTSIEDNAKLSILIETLLRLYVKEPDIKYESSLEDFAALKAAVDKGIKARDVKIVSDNRRKRTKSGSNLSDPARFWLKCSSERMKLLMPVYDKKLQRARSDYESSQGSSDRMEH